MSVIGDHTDLAELRNHEWTREELVRLLKFEGDEDVETKADRVREDVCGDEIHRRGLIEFSNVCKRNCAFCGLRRDNRTLERYRMSEDEIVDSAKNAEALGYKSIVLQSGEDAGFRHDAMCRLVEKIKNTCDVAITLSLGEKTEEEYADFKTAGADRYLLRFETSNAELFAKLKPESSLEKRLACLGILKKLGYQVGSGCMIGLPGQTLEDLANDLLLLKELDLDMVGVGPFIPHPETPLKDAPAGQLNLVLRFVALVRLVTQNTHIPATTALGSIHPYGRQMALERGANVIMPNVTPAKYRRFYELYPNKICITEKPSDCAGCTGSMIHSLGRKVSKDYGHSLK